MTRLATETEVKDYLKLSVYTLQKWRSLRKGPPYYKIEGAVRYDMEQVDLWLKSSRVEKE